MITYRLFGESHGPEVGIEVTGLHQVEIDRAKLRAFLDRRLIEAPRHEPDEPEISWLDDGTLRVVIRNVDIRSDDYAAHQTVPRPGHADYAAYLKTGDIPPGGGKWSGRLTAPYCVAGFVVLEALSKRGIRIAAQVVSAPAAERASNGDSFGAVVEVVATGVPAGLGDAGNAGLESLLSKEFFAIPAVKGVEFGDGFKLAEMCGSEANDAFLVDSATRQVVLGSNHCGGILGGISVGAPIVARLAFKPTPSISLVQDSVDLSTMTPFKLSINGRHDRCVAYRACPVVESAMAMALMDLV